MEIKTTLNQCEDLFKNGIINPSPCFNCGSVQCAICSMELQKDDTKWVRVDDIKTMIKDYRDGFIIDKANSPQLHWARIDTLNMLLKELQDELSQLSED
jgi:hypothetical protein